MRQLWTLSMLLLTLSLSSQLWAGGASHREKKSLLVPDSILEPLFAHASRYASVIDEYEAQLYLKGKLTVHKRNFLIKYVPSMFRLEKGVNEYMQESINELHFKSPAIYERKMKALTGSFGRNNGQITDLFDFFRLNAYSSSLMHDRLLSPLHPKARKHYTYLLDSVVQTPYTHSYKITIQPKLKSTQLVAGHLWIDATDFRVQSLYIEGTYDLVAFKIAAQMGQEGSERFLPKSFHLEVDFKLVGNHLSMGCEAFLDYSRIHCHALPLPSGLAPPTHTLPTHPLQTANQAEKEKEGVSKSEVVESKKQALNQELNESQSKALTEAQSKAQSNQNPAAKTSSPKKSKYDLSSYYPLTCDTTTLITDPVRFDSLRPYPLTPAEEQIYLTSKQREADRQTAADTTTVTEKQLKRQKRLVFWGGIGDALISDYRIDIEKMGSLRMSPLINPLLLEYSARNGISYQQRFIYNSLYTDGRVLRIAPRVGYNFTRNELYVDLNAEWLYRPEKMARLRINAGNGNRIYSSAVLDQLKIYPDSLFSFDKFALEYFKDVYLNIHHTIEPTNGFTVQVGISMHWRSLIKEPQLNLHPPTIPYLTPIQGEIRSNYNSFAPRLRLEWTPGMHYFMNGRRKINVGSKYPTFMLDYERGISNVLGSSGGYERIEFDIQQKINRGCMSNLNYRIGGGMFTNQEDMYFVDFANFTHSNLPGGWDDEIGGVFHLLDRRYYNSSRQYWRGNLTYESPFIFLRPLSKWIGKVQKERLYAGLLFMNHLNPYVEIGYGIATHLFDVGLFMSAVNGSFGSVGASFTFELFNK
ncbi:MAG: DUF5686 family protein [Phocaeicola sp.]